MVTPSLTTVHVKRKLMGQNVTKRLLYRIANPKAPIEKVIMGVDIVAVSYTHLVMLRAEWMYDYYEKRSNYLMMILNAIHTQDSVSFSSKQFRGITYLKEVAENMDKVILLPGGAYNFGSETTQSIYEVTNKFVDMLGKRLIVKDAPARHNLWMDCSLSLIHICLIRK